jgi:hypothetical protein
VLIGHSPSEFLLDFITGFYPTAAVSNRIYLSAQQVPRVMDTLTAALQTYQRRFQPRPAQPGQGQQTPLNPPPPGPSDPPAPEQKPPTQ